MDDDWDVEALLEAPYSKQDEVNGRTREHKEKKKKHHKTRSRSRERETKRRRSRSVEKKRRDKEYYDSSHKRRSRSREKEKRSHASESSYKSRSKHDYVQDRERVRHEREREREYSKKTVRSPSRERKYSSKTKRRSLTPPVKDEEAGSSRDDFGKPARLHRNPDLTPEERDMRTVFCMQLSQRVRARDLEDFFISAGKIQDIRIIMDSKTRRSKGIAYVEFVDVGSVSLALTLNGKKLLGGPVIVQLTQAEKNRVAASASLLQRSDLGPTRLYVGSLHFNITEEMLRGIFEPFGKIDRIELIRDAETGRSKGYGFVTFHDSENAKKALDQLNGFELAGRRMKVNSITDRLDLMQTTSHLDMEEMDRAGIDLGATGRLQLMAKLAEGTGFELPQAAVTALQLTSASIPSSLSANQTVATSCFMLTNMFDPSKETGANWHEEIRNDVIEECRNHGGALHVFVDRFSPQGHVYVKCPNSAAAAASVGVLHGRYFAGRIITAAYVPVVNYHTLFPDAVNAIKVL